MIKNGRNKYYVNNPLYQNYGHIEALKEVLNLPTEKFISLVCIPSRAKVVVKSNNVTRIYDLLDKIKSYDEEILDNSEEIYKSIANANIIDGKERKQHIKSAKLIKEIKEQNFKNKCPKCGGELIKRNGEYGEFLGCSNFPKCRYVKNN